MTIRFTTEGKMIPIGFIWEDKERKIDRFLCCTTAPSAHAGAILTKKFTCVVLGKERNFYFESRTSRWFVEARCED